MIIDAAATDTGMRRSNNQDSYTIVRAPHPEAWRQRGHVFLVADGMGAHAVGELASKMACDRIPHNYMKTRAGTPAEAIVKTFRDVSAEIHSKATANREFQGMGTTSSALLLLPEGALIAHVGDSRVYRVRGGRIDQLSFDHSLVWELVRRNHLTSEQARVSVPKNVITRSLGPEAEIEVDVEGPLAVELGDVFLLCSDGLSGPVEDHELGAFAANFHPRDACRYLVNLANLRGGLDNITVLIVRIGAVDRSRFHRDPAAARRAVRPRRRRPRELAATAHGALQVPQAVRRSGGRRGACLPHGRVSDRRGPGHPLGRADASRPGAGHRAGLVDRLDALGRPAATAGRRPRRRE